MGRGRASGDEQSFDAHVQRESKREGLQPPYGPQIEPLLPDRSAEELRRWWLAVRRAMADPTYVAFVKNWAHAAARRAGLGFNPTYARAIDHRVRVMDEKQDRSRQTHEAIKLGALIAEWLFRGAWRTDAVAGRKSRSQGPRGREGGRGGRRRGGKWSEVDPALLPPLTRLTGSKLRRAAEGIAADAEVQVDSVLRRVRRLKRSSRP